MDNQISFDPAARSAMQLDTARAEAHARLEEYLMTQGGNAAVLLAVREALHRLHEALRAANLDGVAVFCAEVETVLGELSSYPGMLLPLHRDVLQRAGFAMEHYLDDLSHGADDAALRLFPLYQELQQLRGLEIAFEQDLFYPNLAVQLPAGVLEAEPSVDAPARLKAARAEYQRGLLQWLRQENAPEALLSMQQAVSTALHCVPQDEGRAFWWVAQGLLECIGRQGLPPGLDVLRLLGRIDQHLRTVVEGNGGDVHAVMNEMLYLVGRCNATSDKVAEIKRVYRLERYLPELTTQSWLEMPAAVLPVEMSIEPFGGDVASPTGLFDEAAEEALHYARALRQHFTAFKALHTVPPQFIYAAHALAEASRPLKAQPVVELAAALEDWLRARRDMAFEPNAAQLELLEQAVAALEGMAQSVSERRIPQAQPGLVHRLQSDGYPEAPAASGHGGGWESLLESQVRDDVDAQLLPVFLEEADGLGGKIRAVLRAWRESPDDESHGQLLKRLLHTLKGSARMAGAMRIGEIVHAMEDRADDDARARTQASFWDALTGDLDRITGLLEELRAIGPAVPDQKEEPRTESGAARTRVGQERQQAPADERMVPFSSIGERLYRTVRQIAKELNKRANLELPGGGVEVDRRMLERMTAPIEHLLRNAIVHGLENEPVRIRHGKSPIGEIRLDLHQENNQVMLELSDDGAGLNFAALRGKALEQGLLQPNEAASDERLAQLIFVPGFSTATEVSEVAGRGVGLDVVRAEVDALGGRIDVRSKSGQGTQFTIYLPLEPAVG